MTSAAVRLVLVEGAAGEGATIGYDARAIATVRTLAAADPRDVVDAVLGEEAITASRDNRLRSIGVTWTDDAAAEASIVLEALAPSGFENVVTVSQSDAADALASGIRGLGTYDDVAVCIVEPDEAFVAIADAQGVRVEHIRRALDGGDAYELARSLVAELDLDNWTPESVFVLGSADDLDQIVSSLSGAVASPVLSAGEAGLALARGAALASARAMNGSALSVNDVPAVTPSRVPLTPRIGALTSILVAAVLTFVVSLSFALGLRFTSEPDSVTADQRQLSNESGEPPPAAKAPQVAQAAPQPPPPAAPAPPPDAPPPVAQTITAAAAPAPEVVSPIEPPPVYVPPAPVYAPPVPVYVPPVPVAPPPAPVYVPPAPAPVYVPPGSPAYVPPARQPQPRLRDRIIERIPIIGRFHEPKPYVP